MKGKLEIVFDQKPLEQFSFERLLNPTIHNSRKASSSFYNSSADYFLIKDMKNIFKRIKTM